MILSTRIVGIGSPHGDDQAGWRLVEGLVRQHTWLKPHVLAARHPLQLLDRMDSCSRLFVADACRTNAPGGQITRLTWPDSRIVRQHAYSSHAFSLAQALQLADQLGRLPATVVLYGIEVNDCRPGNDLTPAVHRAVLQLETELMQELELAS